MGGRTCVFVCTRVCAVPVAPLFDPTHPTRRDYRRPRVHLYGLATVYSVSIYTPATRTHTSSRKRIRANCTHTQHVYRVNGFIHVGTLVYVFQFLDQLILSRILFNRKKKKNILAGSREI